MQETTLATGRVHMPPCQARGPGHVQDDPMARRLLQETHARLYKWPAAFAGYRAVLTVQEEECLWHGAVTVRPSGEVMVQLDGTDSLRAWVQKSLATQAMHLVATPFERGDGGYIVTFDPQETGVRRHPQRVCRTPARAPAAITPQGLARRRPLARTRVLEFTAHRLLE